MKKKILFPLLALSLLAFPVALSRNAGKVQKHRFMKCFQYEADYQLFIQKWGYPRALDQAIIFNFNANGDALMINDQGARRWFVSLTPQYHAQTENGIDYSYGLMEDSEGQKWMLTTYETGKVFLVGEQGKGFLLKP